MMWCVLMFWSQSRGEAQSAREDYASLARVCFPAARKVDRSRVCALDTGNLSAIREVARMGTGRMKTLAQEILDLQAANAVTAEELGEHEKNLALNVATGLFAETRQDLAGAIIEGAAESRKMDEARAKIQKRQTELDVIVTEKLPRIAAEVAGPRSARALLHVHPFYKETTIVRSSPRVGSPTRPGTPTPSGVQHFQVDLRNDGERDLHHVTVQLEMRDAQDRLESYLGYWDLIEANEIVPLCTWRIGSRHTDHYAGCAIPTGSKSHFVRYSVKVWSDEGRSEVSSQPFEHQRFRTDLATYERETEEATQRKVRQADARRRAEEILSQKPNAGPSTSKPVATASRETPPGDSPKKPVIVARTESEEPADEEITEPYLIDFTAGTEEEPEGWSPVDGKRPLVVNRTAGAPFLTTQINVASASQAPLITIRGDFFLEFSVLSTDNLADGAGSLTATLEGRDGVPPLALSIQKNSKGFSFNVTGAEDESRSVALGGNRPHKVRLERQETAYRILVDGKVVQKHASGDAPDYDVMKLALGNYGLRVYRIQIGPLKKK